MAIIQTIPLGKKYGSMTSSEAQAGTNTESQLISAKVLNDQIDEKISDIGLATVATSGSYNDLSDKPTIPTIPAVNNGTLTIQKNGTTVKTFTANSSSNVTADITVPTKVSELTNDSGYITGVSWNNVSGKPSTFTPKAHTHDYLPLSGGYLTGHFVGRNVDNSLLHLSSCTDYIKGAMLVMYGEGSSDLPGCFRLIARNSSTIYELDGNPKGELSWSGKHIVRSVNGVTADSSGNVSITHVSNADKVEATLVRATADLGLVLANKDSNAPTTTIGWNQVQFYDKNLVQLGYFQLSSNVSTSANVYNWVGRKN